MKPQMTLMLNLRISVDISQTQRFTEEDILNAFSNNEIIFNNHLIVRKQDGAVLGEVISYNKKQQ